MKARLLVPIGFICLLPIWVAAQTPTSTPTTSAETASTDPGYTIERIIGRPDVGDFVVGPGRTEVFVEPGETVVRELSITNRISADRTFRLQVEDIAGTPDGSSALTVIEGERGPYSIRDYISFPTDTITLGLGERARIPITISVPADAEPGGFYGSILVSTVREGAVTEAVQPRNPIIARVGSHFFITVAGETNIAGETLRLSIIPDEWWYESGPINFGIAYQNEGTVHLNPYGELSITNMFGEEVGYVELEPWFVLPNSIRTREISWDREFLFGRYTAEATINRGYDDILDTVTVSFWVLPWKLVALVFGSLFIIVLAIRLFFKTFEFRRRS